MSVASTVYVGPYLLASVRIRRRIADNCGDPEHCPNAKSVFCPVCGLELSERFEERGHVAHDIYEIANDHGFQVADDVAGSLVKQGIPSVSRHVLLPNDTVFYKKFGRSMSVDIPFGSILESWADVSPQEEVSAFKRIYDEQLTAMEAGGLENLAIDWGIVQWCR